MRVEQLPRMRSLGEEVTKLVSSHSVRGMLQSSATGHGLLRLYSQELEIRASLAWKVAVRILRDTDLGSDGDLRSDLKELIGTAIDLASSTLETDLKTHLQKYRLPELSLDARRNEARERHEVEIDLYMDSRDKNRDRAQAAGQYNFYGNVGAVQTGSNAVAHVIQHIGAAEKERLLTAVQAVEEVIKQAAQLETTQRAELLQIASDTKENLNSDTPNKMKLHMTLDVLASAVQGIASGGAAYEALRGAMAMIGM
jgi:hypothetical protein